MFDHLRPYQVPHAEAALGILNRRKALLDASDTGTGKTYVAISLAKARGNVPLVVAPKAVLASWERVAERLGWGVTAINPEKARGSRAKKGARRIVNDAGEVKRMALSEFGEEKPWGSGSFWKWNVEVEEAIFDEARLCGSQSPTLNSKMLIAAKRQFGNVTMLDATLAESPLHLRAPGYVLGLHNLKDYRDFLFEYGCRPSWSGGWEFGDPNDPAVGQAHMDRLNAVLFPDRAVRLRKADIPGFPQSQITTLLVDSTAEERALLDIVEKEMREHGTTPASAGKLELALVPKVIDAAKLKEGVPQVIFVNYRRTALEFHRRLDCPIIWGDGDSGEEVRQLEERFGDRQKVIDEFQANRHPYLVTTYGAGGPGISLHDPLGTLGRVTWELPTFFARFLVQATGRVWRDGGGFSQQFLIGLAGTYQVEVLEVAADKIQRIEAFNDGLLLRQ